MMNPKLKADWVAALRSGKYKQARGALVRARFESGKRTSIYDGGYCCLGVLCKVKGMEDPDIENLSDSTEGLGYHVQTFDDGRGEVHGEHDGIDYDTRAVLAAMNDGGGQPSKTFAELADYIEENL